MCVCGGGGGGGYLNDLITVDFRCFEHFVLHVQEICGLKNVVFYIAVYGPYKPIYETCNFQTHLKLTPCILAYKAHNTQRPHRLFVHICKVQSSQDQIGRA